MSGIDPTSPHPAGFDDRDAPPIDVDHLARQTCDDRDLQNEVLGLMSVQIDRFAAKLGPAGLEETRRIAHALKGAARNVGAFALAEAAEALELSPAGDEARRRLAAEMHRTQAFIDGLRAERGS